MLAFQVHALQLPEPVREYRFDPVRRWRFDLAWVGRQVYAECDGGEWTAGRHSRGRGMQADNEKLNAAALAGWTGYRFTGAQVASGYAIGVLEQAVRAWR